MDICQKYSNNYDKKVSKKYLKSSYLFFLDNNNNLEKTRCECNAHDLHCSFIVTHRARNVNGTSLIVRLHQSVKYRTRAIFQHKTTYGEIYNELLIV